MPESILRYPPEGYLNQLLQKYAASLPSGYKIIKDSSVTKKQKNYSPRENSHKKPMKLPDKPIISFLIHRHNQKKMQVSIMHGQQSKGFLSHDKGKDTLTKSAQFSYCNFGHESIQYSCR